MTKPRVRELDVVRALAVMLIVIYHFNIQLGLHGIGQGPVFLQNFRTENIGSLGISLFIIVSGASLMYNYCGELDINRFYKQRIKSIIPIYYLCYAFTFLFLFYAYGRFPVANSLKTFPLTLLAMDGFLYELIPNCYLCGEWFVGFILILYLLFPLFRSFLLNGNRRFKIAVATIVLGACLVLSYNDLIYKIIPMDLTRNPFLRIPEFVFGMWWGKRARNKVAQNETGGGIVYKTAGVQIALCGTVFIAAVYIDAGLPHNWVAAAAGISMFLFITGMCSFAERFSIPAVLTMAEGVSRHSFAAILVHHNLIAFVISKFDGQSNLGNKELYTLFLCCAAAIVFATVLLYKADQSIRRRFLP